MHTKCLIGVDAYPKTSLRKTSHPCCDSIHNSTTHTDDAIVTLGIGNAHFVLQQPASGCNRLRKAKADFHYETKLGAALLAHASTAGAVTIAADVAAHVVVQRTLAEIVRRTPWTVAGDC